MCMIYYQVVVKLQKRFLAASYGIDLATFFGRFDKDKGGSLDATEFKNLVRRTLKVILCSRRHLFRLLL